MTARQVVVVLAMVLGAGYAVLLYWLALRLLLLTSKLDRVLDEAADRQHGPVFPAEEPEPEPAVVVRPTPFPRTMLVEPVTEPVPVITDLELADDDEDEDDDQMVTREVGGHSFSFRRPTPFL